MLHPAYRIGLTVVLIGLLLSHGASAGDKARPVQDDAKLFSEKALEEANAIIAKIKDKTGKDLVIETKEKGAADLESAGKLAVDRAEVLASKSGLDGVYIIITKQPRHLEVQPIKKGHLTLADRDGLVKILRTNLAKDPDGALLMVAKRALEIFGEGAKREPKADAPPNLLRTVKDEAGIFGPDALAETNATVQKIMAQHHKELFIETVAEGPEKDKATQWARERSNELKVDGVYLVIAKKPGFYRIIVSKKTFAKLFKQDDIVEMEKILGSKESPDTKLTQAAHYVLEAMNKVNETALKEIGHLRGDWVGPKVEYETKDKPAKGNLLLRFGAIGGEPVVNIGVDSAFKSYPIEIRDEGKPLFVVRGADAGKDLVLAYEVSETALEIMAPRTIAVQRVQGKVDLTGNWKRPAKKE
jgi:hypothetical protein